MNLSVVLICYYISRFAQSQLARPASTIISAPSFPCFLALQNQAQI